MKFLLETVGAGVALPLALSWIFGWALTRASKGDIGRRYALPVACVAGFFAAYALLEPKALQPKSYWNWLPWVALVLALVNPVSLASGVKLAERWLFLAILAAAAAWFLTPTFAKLAPPRDQYLLRLAVCIFVLSIAIDPLDQRLGSRWLGAALTISAFAAAALVGIFISLRFGLLGAALAASLAGVSLLIWRGASASMAGCVPVYAATVAALMVAVHTSETLPPECYLLIPAAPLALWPFAVGPLTRLSPGWLTAMRLAALLLPVGVALGRAAWLTRLTEAY